MAVGAGRHGVAIRATTLVAVLASVMITSHPAASRPEPSIPQILAAQNFSASLAPALTVSEVGRIVAGGRHYEIYYILHVSRSGSRHGIQHVVVFGENRRYLGSYLVDHAPARIEGSDVRFNLPKAFGDRLHFDGRGPPTSGVLDGYPVSLVK